MVALDSSLFPADPQFLLLDIGPGFGALAEGYGQDRRVVTVEFNELLASEVAKRTSPWQLSSCAGDAHYLPLRSGSVDGVTILEVLEHIDDPDGVLNEAFRVLKPDAPLCVAVPTRYTEAFYSRVHPRYMTNATHVRIFKRADLCQRLRRAGFEIACVRTEHFEAALAWILHSVLRSNAYPTGWVYDHTWVDPLIDRIVRRVARTKGIGRAVPVARRHFGKSWYIYAVKPRG